MTETCPFVAFSSHEADVLNSVFTNIGHYNYDKAKEVLDKEISGKKGYPVTFWTNFMLSLSQLQQSERTYISLSFLLHKGFLKKEPPKCGYDLLNAEFDRLEEYRKKASSDRDRLLLHFSSQLADYCDSRSVMCELYEKLCMQGSSRLVAYDELLSDLKVVKKKISLGFYHPMLTPLHILFNLETDLLEELLTAMVLLQKWKFYESMQHIFIAHKDLQACLDLHKEARKIGGLFAAGPASPPLLHWMNKFKSAILSKFSLYFYDILAKQTTESNLKSLCSKNTVDFASRIHTFMKKTDCFCTTLVLDSSGVKDYKGPGYNLPTAPTLQLTGLEAYPPIVCFPVEVWEQLKDVQRCRHWPSILMLMSQKASDLALMDRVVSFFDSKAHCTYFLSRVDPLITLISIWECRKNERDSYITQFIQDISIQLRCNRVLSQLKPGVKN